MLKSATLLLIGRGNLYSFRSYCLTRWCSTATVPAIDEDIVAQPLGGPPHYVNPNLEASLIPGKGRGIITKSALKLGDLIMCIQPLAITHGKCHEMPEPGSLVPQLEALWQTTHDDPHSSHRHSSEHPQTSSQSQAKLRLGVARAWLQLLGQQIAPHHMQSFPGAQYHLPLLQQLLHMPVVDTNSKQPTSIKQDDLNVAVLEGKHISQPDMHAIVARNAYGDAYEDFAIVAHLHRQNSTSSLPQDTDPVDTSNLEAMTRSHVGLWPQFSLLNHSCLSNCVHYVVGSHMVVRAVQDIPAETELTINYQGRDDFSPAPLRQQLLQEKYMFTCTCPRCVLESHLPASTRELLTQLHTHTGRELVPRMMQSIEDQNQQALAELGKELCDWCVRLFDNLEILKSSLSTACDSTAMDTDVQSALNQLLPSAANGNASEPNPDATVAATKLQPSAELVAAVQSIGGLEVALLCLEACVYDFIELLHQHAQLSVDDSQAQLADPHAALKLSADILHAVSKGGELHVFLACRLLDEAMAGNGQGDSQLFAKATATEAAKAAEEALLARYGHISPELMLQLAKLNTQISHTFVV